MDEGKTREQPVSEPEALRRELAVEKAAGISGRRLREEQERFAKAFLENSTPMVITTLEEGRIIDVSDAFLKLIGFERRQLIGATSVAVGLLTAAQRENLLRELGERGRVENLEMPIGTHKQGVRQVLMNASVILIGAEKFLLSVFTDITNRKRMEEALQANERRFRTVYENTTLGIFETTLSGRVINANETFARMFGFASARQAVSELDDLAARIYADPRQRGEIIAMVLHEPGPHRFEVAYRRRDGGFFPAVLEIQSVWDRE
ncbi:MAG TPA: PAS domain-containing protein, partial [Syntrophales bacterium]|nr:PAS domain-containing protein [Syntrophales bacterium]